MSKYSHRLCKSFKDVLGFEVKLSIVVKENKNEDNAENEEKRKIENLENITLSSLNELENYPYTFKTFIVGSSNTFAYAACKAVSQNQTGAYNFL